MHVPVDELEAIRVVEATADSVGLEHVEFQERTKLSGTVHQGTTDSAALIPGEDKDRADLVTDECHEPSTRPSVS